MKINIFFISLLFPWLFFSCITHYSFNINNENIPKNELSFRVYADNSSLLLVRINNPYFGNQLQDIEYINGWIQAGDILINFQQEEINISVDIWYEGLNSFAEENYYNRYNIVNNIKYNRATIDRMGVRFNKINNSEEEKIKIFQKTSHFLFFYHLTQREINLLHKQNGRDVKIFFEYNLIIENEIIKIQINEDFVINSTKNHYFIFDPRIY
jgi:hypothetical protein